MAAGDFSASLLSVIKVKAEKMWTDGMQAADYAPNADAAVAVIQNQTARFGELNRRDKDNSIDVTWIKTCGRTTADLAGNCNLEEDELETAKKNYQFDIGQKTGFSVDREKLRTNMYEYMEEVAAGLANSVKLLDEYWAQKVLTKVKTFASTNLAPKPFTFDATKNATIVPNAMYGNVTSPVSGFRLPSAWHKMAIQNKMNAPYFIDNGRIYIDLLDAMLQADGANGADKGAGRRAKKLNITSDLFNFGAAGIANVSTFMINKNAVAFKTYNRHADKPLFIGGKVGQTHYTIKSIALAGVKYDVIHEVKCKEVGGVTHFYDTWRLITRGGVWLNPESCPVTIASGSNPPAGTHTPSGVLSFVSDDETV